MGKGGKKLDPKRYATTSIAKPSSSTVSKSENDNEEISKGKGKVKVQKSKEETLLKYAKKTAIKVIEAEVVVAEDPNEPPKLLYETMNPSSNIKLKRLIDGITNPPYPKSFSASGNADLVVSKVTFPFAFSTVIEEKLLSLTKLKEVLESDSNFSFPEVGSGRPSNILENLNIVYLTLVQLGYPEDSIKLAMDCVANPNSVLNVIAWIELETNPKPSNAEKKSNPSIEEKESKSSSIEEKLIVELDQKPMDISMESLKLQVEMEPETVFQAIDDDDPMAGLLNEILCPEDCEIEAEDKALLSECETKSEEMMIDLFDEDNGLPSIPAKDASLPRINVNLREFEVSNWSGKFPKQMLFDFSRKMTRTNEQLKFQAIGKSHYHRLKVIVPIGKGKYETFEMLHEGTRTIKEAENYVCTLALYSMNKNTTLYNSLPGCYRSLWLEWLQKDKFRDITEQNLSDSDRISFLEGLIIKKKLSTTSIEAANRLNGDIRGDNENVKSEKYIIEPLADKDKRLQDYVEALIQSGQYKRILETRQELPIFQKRQEILNMISGPGQVIIVCGLTGSGKSTQIPQFILEQELLAGRGSTTRIVCTQPRRISATSIAARVSEEMGESKVGGLVGYQIRLETCASEHTRLLFCTTGILLKKLESDPLLCDVNYLIIDEVHERSLDSDFLLIIMKRLLRKRNNLKLILMSATIDSEKFSKHFDDCPIVSVGGRLFDVESYFLEDMIEFSKYQLDPDSIYAKKRDQLARKFSVEYSGKSGQKNTYQEEVDEFEWILNGSLPPELDCLVSVDESRERNYSKITLKSLFSYDEYKINYELLEQFIHWLIFIAPKEGFCPGKGSILIFMPGWFEIKNLCDILRGNPKFADPQKFWILPLHASLPSHEQSKVFSAPPKGTRKIVVSTNVAETGITIPDVVFVIDSGKSKEIRHEAGKRLTKLEENFISQDNVKQRKGRAGRVQNGFCFHLYTRYRFENKLRPFQTCEMLRLPLEDLCLRIKLCRFGKIWDFLSEAVDIPSENSVKQSIASLIEFGALDENENLTEIGKYIAAIPVDISLAKLCIMGTLIGCMDAVITIAAILSHTKSIFTSNAIGCQSFIMKQFPKNENSDLIVLYLAYQTWKEICFRPHMKAFELRNLCEKTFLSHFDLCQVEEIKNQIYNYICDAGFVTNDSKQIRRQSIDFCPVNVASPRNRNNSNLEAIKFALGLGLYPNLLHWHNKSFFWLNHSSPGKELMQVKLHSSSFQSGPFSYNSWFVFYRMIKSTRLFSFDVSNIPILAVLLTCSSLDLRHCFVKNKDGCRLMLVDGVMFLECKSLLSILLVSYLRDLFQRELENALKMKGNNGIEIIDFLFPLSIK